MANIVLNQFKAKVADGTVDIVADTLKIGLATATYVPAAADTFLDDGSADDFSSGELSVTGYTGGFGGAGRKTLAGKSVSQDNPNNRAEWTFTSPVTWTALGSGQTIAWAVVLKEITNDAASLPLVAFDVADTPTNGGDVSLNVNAEGAVQFS